MTSGGAGAWFVLRVKARQEESVAVQLRHKGYDLLVPRYRARKRRSDRVMEVDLPLFPGYIFCRLDPSRRLPVLITPGVSMIVGSGKTPVPVPDEEVEAVRAVVGSGLSLAPWPYLRAGDRIRIEEGPLCGLEGILLEVRRMPRLVVSVTLLQRSVAVEIDRCWVTPLGPARLPGCTASMPPALRRGAGTA